MEKQPLVSAIVTTYKRDADTVGRALRSIVNQTYEALEIILVNDYPEDEQLSAQLAALCGSFEREIRYCPMEKNSGSNAARNHGAESARGEFIAFLDDDDEWAEKKIELQVQAAGSDPGVGIVYGNYQIISPKYSEIRVRNQNRLPEGDIYGRLFTSNFIGSTSFPMLRKKAFDEAGCFNKDVPALQDIELWLRITKSYTAKYVHEPLGTYYFYEGDRISAHPERRIRGYEMIYEQHKDYLAEHKRAKADFDLFGVTFYVNGRNFGQAWKLLWEAIRLNPGNIKANTFMLMKWFVRIFIPAKVV